MTTNKKRVDKVVISPPNFELAEFHLTGDTSLLQHRFASRVKSEIRATQEAGSTTKKGTKKESRDFERDFREACHVSTEGWYGIPAAAFRNAMVSACRLCGFKMTHAKLSVFATADGFEEDGTPLVRITKGKPVMDVRPVRLPNGTMTLASRARYPQGWKAKLVVKFDADQFTVADITNLVIRVGTQIGIQEGRHDSRKSTGLGMGTFLIDENGGKK